jgi:hypothetical protein
VTLGGLRYSQVCKDAHFFKRDGSAVAGETLSDLIKPLIDRIKSGMQGFVVQVKNIADGYHPKKPVVTFEVHKSLFSHTTDESDEAQQNIHLSQLQ